MVCLVWWCGNMFCLCGSLRKARVVARGYLKKGGLGWRALRLRSVAGHILVGRRGGVGGGGGGERGALQAPWTLLFITIVEKGV